MNLSFSLIGILFGVIYSLDFWRGRSGKYSFKYWGLLNLLIGVIPAIGSELNLEIPMSATAWFYGSVAGSALMVVLAIAFYFARPLIREAHSYGMNTTQIDVLIRGYEAVKDEIAAYHQKQMIETGELEPSYLHRMLPEYVSDLFTNIEQVVGESGPHGSDTPLADQLLGAVAYMFTAFHTLFISKSSSRFSFRVYDEQTDSMLCVYCTEEGFKDNLPSPIPMDKKNMIRRSLKIGGAALYSENRDWHYKTKRDSIGRKDVSFTNYVSLAIDPLFEHRTRFSFNFDVDSNFEVITGLFARFGIFGLIGNSITNIVRNKIGDYQVDDLVSQLLLKNEITQENLIHES